MANPDAINEKLNYHFINDNDDINNEFNNKNIMTNPIEVIKNREDIIKKQSEQMLNLVEIVQKYNEENEGLQKIVKECSNKIKPEIIKDIDYMKNLISNQLILFMILLILIALLYYKKMNF
jgi:hypothetical protein